MMIKFVIKTTITRKSSNQCKSAINSSKFVSITICHKIQEKVDCSLEFKINASTSGLFNKSAKHDKETTTLSPLNNNC